MSMRSAKLIVGALIALTACGYTSAQDTAGPPLCFSSKIGHRSIKFQRHELGIFSICIPETLTRRRTARCGETCYIFENADMYFDTDMTGSAWRPTFQKRYPSYTQVDKPIDGKQSTVWYFEDFGDYKYVSGASIIFERGHVGMGVYLFSRSTDSRPIADRMFNSIRFNKPEQQ